MDLHGFDERERRTFPLLGVTARLYRHERIGTEVLHLESDEPNLSFIVGVPTVPSSNDGVAHVLEHMVLAGSKRFPLKDPFFTMLKGSVAGFMNALTGSDMTLYPFSTRVKRDYLNLLQVYLDAVFRPLLTRRTFDQEAWHFEAGEREGELALRGIVFNEMKGAAADPNRAAYLAEAQGLFPDTPLRFDAGGTPEAIPDLSHERIRAFHAEHYHPSRARIVLHGPVPLEETFAELAQYLEEVEPLPPHGPLPLQAKFDAARRASGTYPGTAEDKAIATVAWAFDEPADPSERWTLELLEHVLMGRASAPLREALTDSGLGEAFLGGLHAEDPQPVMRVGLRGVANENVTQVHTLVQDTLQRVAERGIDARDLEAARNRIEFDIRELDVFGGQRGLALGMAALGPWLQGRDPLHELDWDRALARLDAKLAQGPDTVASLVQTHLLENPHRVDVTVLPDPDLSARREAEERERLRQEAERLGATGVAEALRETARRAEEQARPDPEEVVATLPKLARDDLGPPPPEVPIRESREGGVRRMRVTLPTRGIVYLEAGFDLSVLPERLQPLAGIAGRLLLETGTTRRERAELERAIDADTGGISVRLETVAGGTDGAAVTNLYLRGRALASKAQTLAALMQEVATEARIDDLERLRTFAVETESRRRAALEAQGHRFALQRLAAGDDPVDRLSDRLTGIASLAELRELARRCREDPEALRADLEAFRGALLARGGMLLGTTAGEAESAAADAAAQAFAQGLPARGSEPGPLSPATDAPTAEGWVLPGRVHYTAAGTRLTVGATVPGGWLAAARWFANEVMLTELRFKGGAYGAGAALDPVTGAWRMHAYRDPNLTESLAVMTSVAERLRAAAATVSGDDFETLAVAVVGSLYPHLAPAERGYRAMLRRVRGSEGLRLRLREEVLAAGPDAFGALADAIEAAPPLRAVVLGPQASLNQQRGAFDWKVRELRS